QAGVQRVRVRHRVRRGRDRAAADDGPGLLLRAPAKGTVRRMATTIKTSRTLAKAGVLTGLVIGGLFAGLPVLWLLSTSFKANGDVFHNPPKLITKSFSLD